MNASRFEIGGTNGEGGEHEPRPTTDFNKKKQFKHSAKSKTV